MGTYQNTDTNMNRNLIEPEYGTVIIYVSPLKTRNKYGAYLYIGRGHQLISFGEQVRKKENTKDGNAKGKEKRIDTGR